MKNGDYSTFSVRSIGKSEEKIVKVLDKIASHCKEHNCQTCKFGMQKSRAGHVCQIAALAQMLACSPSEWFFNEIVDILGV